MVSLQPNRMSTGAQYMDEVMPSDTNAANSSDVEPILATTNNAEFKKMRTIPMCGVHLFISIVVSIAGIVMTLLWTKDKAKNELFYIMNTLRAAFWLVTFLFCKLLCKHHNELRMNGYHQFHRDIRRHNNVAFNAVSGINTLMMLIQSNSHLLWQADFYQSMSVIQATETLMLAISHGYYIYTVNRFNSYAPCADALNNSNSSGDSYYMDRSFITVDPLEKQADIIAHLQDLNQIINEELFKREHNNDM